MSVQAKIYLAIGIATCSVAAIVLWTLFEWPLQDRFPGPLYLELTGIVWMLFFLLATVSFVALYEVREAGPIALLPLAIQVAGVLVVFYAPLDRLWIEGNFRFYRSEREEVVERVLSGELQPNVFMRPRLIALKEPYPTLSMGGNQIVVEERMGQRLIFFYTYRGPGSNFAGFIYLPTGVDPRDSGLASRQLEVVVPMAAHWYYVAPARGAD